MGPDYALAIIVVGIAVCIAAVKITRIIVMKGKDGGFP